MAAQEGDLLRRRNVEHMDAGARPARHADQPLGAAQRGDLVAPDRMRGGIARDLQRGPLAQPEFVLGMEGGAPARILQDRVDAVVVLDQEVAGGRAHEHLDAGRARQPLELADIAGIVARSAHPESEVAMHAVGRARHLVGKRGFARRQRIGVGHLEDGGDAAQHRRARARLQIFLVLQPRLAEMHLAVDHARQDVQAGAVDDFAGGATRQVADRRNAPGDDADITPAGTVMIDHRAARQDQVVGLRHVVCHLARPSARAYVMALPIASIEPFHADRLPHRPRSRVRFRTGCGASAAERHHHRSRRARRPARRNRAHC